MALITKDKEVDLSSEGRSEYYYPNNISRIILLSIEDILGRHGVNAILNFAKLPHLVNNYPPGNLELGFSFSQLSAILASLDELFGQRAGRAISVRVGRETFRRGLKELGPILGMSDLALRAIPLGIKIKIGLNVFAETLNKFTEQVVRLEEERSQYYWIIERCPMCWGRSTSEPCCHLALGILHEAAEWVSNGRVFDIEQTSCIAMGDDSCIFVVNKRPTSRHK